MGHQTGEEIKQERVTVMGSDLGLLFDSLYNEVVWIRFKWIEFIELYGTNDKRIDVMNRSAPWIFFIVQRVLFDDILLGLCKITDPQGMGKDESASLRALTPLITDQKLKNDLLRGLTTVLKGTEFARDWRNRKIAHKDRKLSVGDNRAVPLQEANREKVIEALQSIENLIHLIEAHYFKSETAFKLLSSDRGAISLLNLLNDGFEFRAAQDKLLKDIEDSL